MTQKVLLLMPQQSMELLIGIMHTQLYERMFTRMGYEVHKYVMPGIKNVYSDGLVNSLASTYGTTLADYDFGLWPYSTNAEWNDIDEWGQMVLGGLDVTTPLFVASWANHSNYNEFGFTGVLDATNYHVYSWKGIEYIGRGYNGVQNVAFAYASTWESLVEPSRTTNSSTLGRTRLCRYQVTGSGWIYCNLSSVGSSRESFQTLILLQEAIDAGHIPSPPEPLGVAVSLDDFPGAPSTTYPTVLADVQAMYALQVKYKIPITYGWHTTLVGGYLSEVLEFVAENSVTNNGLIYPVDHNISGAARADYSFENGNAINNANVNLADSDIMVGQKIIVTGSTSNDGTYTVAGVATGSITTVESTALEATGATVRINTAIQWAGSTLAEITEMHAVSIHNSNLYSIPSGDDVGNSNNYGFRMFPNHKCDGLGAVYCASKGITHGRLAKSTLDENIGESSTHLLAGNTSEYSADDWSLGPVSYADVTFLIGANVAAATLNSIDLDDGLTLVNGYTTMNRGLFAHSSALGEVAYAHAQNIDGSDANSQFLWGVDRMGQLVTKMPGLLKWELPTNI